MNISKTEVALFKPPRKVPDVSLKLNVIRKRLFPTNSLKYLDINIYKKLNQKQLISDIDITLNGENAILSKLRHFIHRKTLKSIHDTIFESHLCYFSLDWAKKKKIKLKDILFCKRNYIFRIIYFQSRNAHTSPLFRESNILKLPDKNPLKNYPLIKKIWATFYPQSLKICLLFNLILMLTVLVGPI